MLSIGKLGLGHWAYYEQSVADGREDYYAGAGEEQGRYLGRGSEALGLAGEVADGDLKHLFRGTHPTQPGRWLDRQHQDKLKPKVIKLPDGREIAGPTPVATAAFDLTYSAPKSVSVLWAMSDGPVALDIKQAHEAAVTQSLDYLERVACLTRRARPGTDTCEARGSWPSPTTTAPAGPAIRSSTRTCSSPTPPRLKAATPHSTARRSTARPRPQASSTTPS